MNESEGGRSRNHRKERNLNLVLPLNSDFLRPHSSSHTLFHAVPVRSLFSQHEHTSATDTEAAVSFAF